VVRPFGPQAEAVRAAPVAAMKDQLDLPVLGKVKGKARQPASPPARQPASCPRLFHCVERGLGG